MQSSLSSKTFCEILRFINFARILVFSSWKKVGHLYKRFQYDIVLYQYQSFIKRLQLGLFSENFVISYFTTFLRISSFQLSQKDLTTLQLLRILHEILIKSKVLILTLTRVIFRCEISNFTTFAKILVFNLQKQTGQLCSCCQYHIVLLQYQKFTINLQLGLSPNKMCNLRNFAFYNISQNLGFLLSEKDLTTLRLLRILHEIKIISKFLIMTTARTTLTKICISRNFAFCNFYQNLGFQSLEEGWATLQPLLVRVVS